MRYDIASIYKEKREYHKSTKGANSIKHGVKVKRLDKFHQEAEVHHFKIQTDEHAEPWGGGGRAPSPLEYFLSALGFSINNQILIQSEVNGVKLDSLETLVTGSFDSKGCLDIKGHNPNIYKISLDFTVASDSSHEKLQEILRKATACDPVYQTLRKAARIEKKLHLSGGTNAKHVTNPKGDGGK